MVPILLTFEEACGWSLSSLLQGSLHLLYLWGKHNGPCPPLLWQVRGSFHSAPLMGGPGWLPSLSPLGGAGVVSDLIHYGETGESLLSYLEE